ncbi:MAG: general secretion pathway protein GspK [Bdellovibrionales bacterium]|nr:general secretion pathway protein GspK [Bdellovibrionales bacterium]
MAWTRRFKEKLRLKPGTERGTDESGIALFMVVSAMTILSVVVTEFTYVAQVNARSSVDASDTLKAHYLAKTGFKLSLLRLRAYKELKAFGKGNSSLPQIPRNILDQIWSFPFFYPIPSNVPGLTIAMKDDIDKFTNDSNLPGHFTATIESETSKVGINSMLSAMAPPPAPKPSGSPTPSTSPSGKPAGFDVEEARKGVKDLISNLLEEKFKKDQDFANEYRDLEVDELFDNLLGWMDFTYQPKNSSGKQTIPYKHGPLYSLTELHMIYPMDDGLYDLLAPNFTPFITPGINVNKIEEPMLRALLVGITDEEVTQFYKDRDSEEVDGTFKSADDFFKYVEGHVAAFKSSTTLDDLKARLVKQGIQILTDAEIFKITVVAEVNKASRILEAWLLLESGAGGGAKSGSAGGSSPDSNSPDVNLNQPIPGDTSGGKPSNAQPNAAGLRLLYVRES